ncbi:MAG: DUF4337 domain-containing protein [Syntrophobacteraceae bacterium]
MAEDKKDPWLNYLALTTVIFAVCATLSTFKGGSYSTRSVMSQTQAANQWAYYQAKSLKGYLYEIQKEVLELDLQEREAVPNPVGCEPLKDRIGSYGKRIAKYDAEKAEIAKAAKDLEQMRDDAQRHSKIFGIAVIFLQIAILMSSVAALMKKKPVWYLGVVFGVVGVVYFANGFFLFFE